MGPDMAALRALVTALYNLADGLGQNATVVSGQAQAGWVSSAASQYSAKVIQESSDLQVAARQVSDAAATLQRHITAVESTIAEITKVAKDVENGVEDAWNTLSGDARKAWDDMSQGAENGASDVLKGIESLF